MEGVLRLFFALPLPPRMQEALGIWDRAHPGIRGWCRPGDLHLTLAFLGELPPDALPGLEDAARAVAAGHRPFTLRTAGLDGFADARRARVIWLGLEPCPVLEGLAADLRRALVARGVPFDPKPFRPHLTLARLRRPRPAGAFPPPAPGTFPAERIVLFESRQPAGYLPLRAWPLGPPDPGV